MIIVAGLTADGQPICAGSTACDQLGTSTTTVHHVSSCSKFVAESWDGEHAEHDVSSSPTKAVFDDFRVDSPTAISASSPLSPRPHPLQPSSSIDGGDAPPIASSSQFERPRSASLAAALLELDPRGVPLVQFFKFATEHPHPLLEVEDEADVDGDACDHDTELVVTKLLFTLNQLKMTASDKHREALTRLRELEEELRRAGAVTPADPAVADAVARALAIAGAGRDVQIRVNQSRHTTTTKTVYETETPGMADVDGDKIRELQQQILASLSSGAGGNENVPESGGTTQKKETAEEGFTNDDGSVVVSKKMTRVVTTTRTTMPGEGEDATTASSTAPESPTASMGSVKDRIAKFESLKDDKEKETSPTGSGLSVDIIVTPHTPIPPDDDDEDEGPQEPLSPTEEHVATAELKHSPPPTASTDGHDDRDVSTEEPIRAPVAAARRSIPHVHTDTTSTTTTTTTTKTVREGPESDDEDKESHERHELPVQRESEDEESFGDRALAFAKKAGIVAGGVVAAPVALAAIGAKSAYDALTKDDEPEEHRFEQRTQETPEYTQTTSPDSVSRTFHDEPEAHRRDSPASEAEHPSPVVSEKSLPHHEYTETTTATTTTRNYHDEEHVSDRRSSDIPGEEHLFEEPHAVESHEYDHPSSASSERKSSVKSTEERRRPSEASVHFEQTSPVPSEVERRLSGVSGDDHQDPSVEQFSEPQTVESHEYEQHFADPSERKSSLQSSEARRQSSSSEHFDQSSPAASVKSIPQSPATSIAHDYTETTTTTATTRTFHDEPESEQPHVDESDSRASEAQQRSPSSSEKSLPHHEYPTAADESSPRQAHGVRRPSDPSVPHGGDLSDEEKESFGDRALAFAKKAGLVAGGVVAAPVALAAIGAKSAYDALTKDDEPEEHQFEQRIQETPEYTQMTTPEAVSRTSHDEPEAHRRDSRASEAEHPSPVASEKSLPHHEFTETTMTTTESDHRSSDAHGDENLFQEPHAVVSNEYDRPSTASSERKSSVNSSEDRRRPSGVSIRLEQPSPVASEKSIPDSPLTKDDEPNDGHVEDAHNYTAIHDDEAATTISEEPETARRASPTSDISQPSSIPSETTVPHYDYTETTTTTIKTTQSIPAQPQTSESHESEYDHPSPAQDVEGQRRLSSTSVEQTRHQESLNDEQSPTASDKFVSHDFMKPQIDQSYELEHEGQTRYGEEQPMLPATSETSLGRPHDYAETSTTTVITRTSPVDNSREPAVDQPSPVDSEKSIPHEFTETTTRREPEFDERRFSDDHTTFPRTEDFEHAGGIDNEGFREVESPVTAHGHAVDLTTTTTTTTISKTIYDPEDEQEMPEAGHAHPDVGFVAPLSKTTTTVTSYTVERSGSPEELRYDDAAEERALSPVPSEGSQVSRKRSGTQPPSDMERSESEPSRIFETTTTTTMTTVTRDYHQGDDDVASNAEETANSAPTASEQVDPSSFHHQEFDRSSPTSSERSQLQQEKLSHVESPVSSERSVPTHGHDEPYHYDVIGEAEEEREGESLGDKMLGFAKKAGIVAGGVIAAPVALAAVGAKAAYDKMREGSDDEEDVEERTRRAIEQHGDSPADQHLMQPQAQTHVDTYSTASTASAEHQEERPNYGIDDVAAEKPSSPAASDSSTQAEDHQSRPHSGGAVQEHELSEPFHTQTTAREDVVGELKKSLELDRRKVYDEQVASEEHSSPVHGEIRGAEEDEPTMTMTTTTTVEEFHRRASDDRPLDSPTSSEHDHEYIERVTTTTTTVTQEHVEESLDERIPDEQASTASLAGSASSPEPREYIKKTETTTVTTEIFEVSDDEEDKTGGRQESSHHSPEPRLLETKETTTTTVTRDYYDEPETDDQHEASATSESSQSEAQDKSSFAPEQHSFIESTTTTFTRTIHDQPEEYSAPSAQPTDAWSENDQDYEPSILTEAFHGASVDDEVPAFDAPPAPKSESRKSSTGQTTPASESTGAQSVARDESHDVRRQLDHSDPHDGDQSDEEKESFGDRALAFAKKAGLVAGGVVAAPVALAAIGAKSAYDALTKDDEPEEHQFEQRIQETPEYTQMTTPVAVSRTSHDEPEAHRRDSRASEAEHPSPVASEKSLPHHEFTEATMMTTTTRTYHDEEPESDRQSSDAHFEENPFEEPHAVESHEYDHPSSASSERKSSVKSTEERRRPSELSVRFEQPSPVRSEAERRDSAKSDDEHHGQVSPVTTATTRRTFNERESEERRLETDRPHIVESDEFEQDGSPSQERRSPIASGSEYPRHEYTETTTTTTVVRTHDDGGSAAEEDKLPTLESFEPETRAYHDEDVARRSSSQFSQHSPAVSESSIPRQSHPQEHETLVDEPQAVESHDYDQPPFEANRKSSVDSSHRRLSHPSSQHHDEPSPISPERPSSVVSSDAQRRPSESSEAERRGSTRSSEVHAQTSDHPSPVASERSGFHEHVETTTTTTTTSYHDEREDRQFDQDDDVSPLEERPPLVAQRTSLPHAKASDNDGDYQEAKTTASPGPSETFLKEQPTPGEGDYQFQALSHQSDVQYRHEEGDDSDQESLGDKMLGFAKKAGMVAGGVIAAPVALAAVGAKTVYDKLQGDEDEFVEKFEPEGSSQDFDKSPEEQEKRQPASAARSDQELPSPQKSLELSEGPEHVAELHDEPLAHDEHSDVQQQYEHTSYSQNQPEVLGERIASSASSNHDDDFRQETIERTESTEETGFVADVESPIDSKKSASFNDEHELPREHLELHPSTVKRSGEVQDFVEAAVHTPMMKEVSETFEMSDRPHEEAHLLQRREEDDQAKAADSQKGSPEHAETSPRAEVAQQEYELEHQTKNHEQADVQHYQQEHEYPTEPDESSPRQAHDVRRPSDPSVPHGGDQSDEEKESFGDRALAFAKKAGLVAGGVVAAPVALAAIGAKSAYDALTKDDEPEEHQFEQGLQETPEYTQTTTAEAISRTFHDKPEAQRRDSRASETEQPSPVVSEKSLPHHDYTETTTTTTIARTYHDEEPVSDRRSSDAQFEEHPFEEPHAIESQEYDHPSSASSERKSSVKSTEERRRPSEASVHFEQTSPVPSEVERRLSGVSGDDHQDPSAEQFSEPQTVESHEYEQHFADPSERKSSLQSSEARRQSSSSEHFDRSSPAASVKSIPQSPALSIPHDYTETTTTITTTRTFHDEPESEEPHVGESDSRASEAQQRSPSSSEKYLPHHEYPTAADESSPRTFHDEPKSEELRLESDEPHVVESDEFEQERSPSQEKLSAISPGAEFPHHEYTETTTTTTVIRTYEDAPEAVGHQRAAEPQLIESDEFDHDRGHASATDMLSPSASEKSVPHEHTETTTTTTVTRSFHDYDDEPDVDSAKSHAEVHEEHLFPNEPHVVESEDYEPSATDSERRSSLKSDGQHRASQQSGALEQSFPAATGSMTPHSTAPISETAAFREDQDATVVESYEYDQSGHGSSRASVKEQMSPSASDKLQLFDEPERDAEAETRRSSEAYPDYGRRASDEEQTPYSIESQSYEKEEHPIPGLSGESFHREHTETIATDATTYEDLSHAVAHKPKSPAPSERSSGEPYEEQPQEEHSQDRSSRIMFPDNAISPEESTEEPETTQASQQREYFETHPATSETTTTTSSTYQRFEEPSVDERQSPDIEEEQQRRQSAASEEKLRHDVQMPHDEESGEEEEKKSGFGDKVLGFAKKAGMVAGGVIAAPAVLAAVGAKSAYDALKKKNDDDDNDDDDTKEEFGEFQQSPRKARDYSPPKFPSQGLSDEEDDEMNERDRLLAKSPERSRQRYESEETTEHDRLLGSPTETHKTYEFSREERIVDTDEYDSGRQDRGLVSPTPSVEHDDHKHPKHTDDATSSQMSTQAVDDAQIVESDEYRPHEHERRLSSPVASESSDHDATEKFRIQESPTDFVHVERDSEAHPEQHVERYEPRDQHDAEYVVDSDEYNAPRYERGIQSPARSEDGEDDNERDQLLRDSDSTTYSIGTRDQPMATVSEDFEVPSIEAYVIESEEYAPHAEQRLASPTPSESSEEHSQRRSSPAHVEITINPAEPHRGSLSETAIENVNRVRYGNVDDDDDVAEAQSDESGHLDNEWKVYDMHGEVLDEFSQQLTDDVIQEAEANASQFFTASPRQPRKFLKQESCQEVTIEHEVDYQSDLQEKLDILANEGRSQLGSVREEDQLDIIHESDYEQEDEKPTHDEHHDVRDAHDAHDAHDAITATASRLVAEVMEQVLEVGDDQKTVTTESNMYYTTTDHSKDDQYDTCVTSQEDTYESAHGWTSQESEYTTATSGATSRLSDTDTDARQDAATPLAVLSPVDSDRHFTVSQDYEVPVIRAFDLSDDIGTARSTPDVSLQVTYEEEENEDMMPTSPSGVLLAPDMDPGRPISPVPPGRAHHRPQSATADDGDDDDDDDQGIFVFVEKSDVTDQPTTDQAERSIHDRAMEASADDSDSRYSRQLSDMSSESHADTVIPKHPSHEPDSATDIEDIQSMYEATTRSGSTDSLDKHSTSSSVIVRHVSDDKQSSPALSARSLPADSETEMKLTTEQTADVVTSTHENKENQDESPEKLSPQGESPQSADRSPGDKADELAGFEVYPPEGQEQPADLETVEEEPEDSDSLNGGSGHSSVGIPSETLGLAGKYKHVSSDNLSLTSLQEFERLEQVVAARGDQSLTTSEIELYAAGRLRSGEGSVSSLAEFEKIEQEMAANQSPQDEVMMLSDIREESEAEDMSIRDDDEEAEPSDAELKTRPVQDDDIRGATPIATSPTDSLEREPFAAAAHHIQTLETSTDSLEPTFHEIAVEQRDRHDSSVDDTSLAEYEVVGRMDADSLEHLPQDKDSLLEGASQDVASQETRGMLSGDTVDTFHDDDDRDSLDGEMSNMLRSYPTTLTTFQTTAVCPDGTVQTISRRVETRVRDPVMSHVTFTGTESQERLNQLPDEEQFETVDAEGNVTRTHFRRQSPTSQRQ